MIDRWRFEMLTDNPDRSSWELRTFASVRAELELFAAKVNALVEAARAPLAPGSVDVMTECGDLLEGDLRFEAVLAELEEVARAMRPGSTRRPSRKPVRR